jgi:hypothetical protein
MMKKNVAWMFIGLVAIVWAEPVPGNKPGVGLYPNDYGPAAIDVSGYPAEMQQTYKVFAMKCSACHTIARPINSQFLELSAAEQAALKKTQPEIFQNDKVWHVGDDVWKRYVKKMMAKPGCPVGPDGKRIWDFLVFDAKARKTGERAKAWQAHRQKLLTDFKAKQPDAYAHLFQD